MTHPPKPFHQLVWIDHEKAKIFGVTRHGLQELEVVQAPDQDRGHVHHKAGTVGSGHTAPSQAFLLKVTAAIAEAREILIVGPGHTKMALKSCIALNAPMLNKRIKGVEPMDKCGRGELQAFATLYFRQIDQIQP